MEIEDGMDERVQESLKLLKITKDGAELKLEGRLVGHWVSLLEDIHEAHTRTSEAILVLDVSAVGFADRNGVQLLHRLRNQGVVFQGCSPFLEELCRDA